MTWLQNRIVAPLATGAIAALFAVGCGSTSDAASLDGTDSGRSGVDEGAPSDSDNSRDEGTTDSLTDVPTAADAAPPFPPPETACEYAFFKNYFDKDNGTTFASVRDATFVHVVEQVKALQSCGAKITLGGMLSLMIFEGGGAKVAFYNDRCKENSYDTSPTCWNDPKARYSYQYGLAPVHTSNFHPCADVTYTSKMRSRLAKAMLDAGFMPSASAIAAVGGELRTFCPSATPTIVDYYILTAHSAFGVPKDNAGNDLTNAGKYPFFTPRVVIDMFFAEIGGYCPALTSDEAAIAIYGGGDSSYRTATKQALILKLWTDWKSVACP